MRVYQSIKSYIFMAAGFSFIKGTCEVIGLLLIQVLINLVSQPQHLNYSQIHLIIGAMGVGWLIKYIFHHNTMLEGALFPAKMKGALLLALTRRILTFSQNTAELNEVGRVTNILSNDFNRIEKKFRFVIQSLSLPIQFTAIAAVVFSRLKWMALIIFLIIALAIGLQLLMSKLEAKYQVEVNAHKDSRIKTYTQLLEGIRTIKLYAWEMAFKDMVQEIRKI